MLPFVGGDYASAGHSKLLILGESFYFPEESTVHKDSGGWYSANQGSLTEDEIVYINCRELVECDWSSPGHRMYRELNSCLAELDLPSLDRPISHICYTNAFLRPASETGESFAGCCVDQDVAVSLDVLTKVVAALAPDSVIFASKYAWDVVGWRLAEQVSATRFDFVSHPADPHHWNVKSYEHGREKFIALLKGWATKTG